MSKYKDPNKKVIKNSDEINLDGVLYLIPDKYIPNLDLGIEQQWIYKFILASVIHKQRSKVLLEQLNKNHLDKYIIITERLFAYCITGYLDNINLTLWEQEIINKIPNTIITHLNPLISERLEN
jgi:hypothetical protein